MVYRPGCDRLHVVNASAKDVLDGLIAGLTAAELALAWERRHGLPEQRALALILDTAQALASAGLTGTPPEPRQREQFSYPFSDQVCDAAAPLATSYRIGPRSLQIRYANPRLAALLRPYLDHLREPAAEPQASFEILERDGRRCLLHRHRQLLDTSSDQELILGTLFHLAESIRDDAAHLLILHAGAVARGEQALVFPAAGGRGKSTLVAYLAHHGYAYLADDMLPVRWDGRIDPVPNCIGLKQGSWPVVAAFRPDLMDGQVFELSGRRLRYLVPATGAGVCHQPLPVAALVFPQYQPGAEASLRPLRASEALSEIVESQAYLPMPLEPGRVAALVDWTAHRAAYRLVYGALPEAHRLLAALLQ